MKYIFLLSTLLFFSCNNNLNIIKSLNHSDVNFIWYRDYCGSNGCDFIILRNKTNELIIYEYYDFGLKDIRIKNDTLFVYHSETIKKKDLFNYSEGNLLGNYVKFISVPPNTCNYLQLKNNSPHCSKVLSNPN